MNVQSIYAGFSLKDPSKPKTRLNTRTEDQLNGNNCTAFFFFTTQFKQSIISHNDFTVNLGKQA